MQLAGFRGFRLFEGFFLRPFHCSAVGDEAKILRLHCTPSPQSVLQGLNRLWKNAGFEKKAALRS
jgi:hypothetical protein